MKRILPLLLLLVIALPVIAKPAARKAAAKSAAAICDVMADGKGESTLTVIVALNGARWLCSEDAVGLLHEGDRLPLYTPQGRPLGQVALKDGGRLRSREEDSIGEALQFRALVQPASGVTDATTDRPATRFATWSNGVPPPRWTRWTELPEPAKGSPYWRVAEDWVRSHKLSAHALEALQFAQAARADVNGDGKDEVFLSFCGFAGGPDAKGNWDELQKPFSCLLMRRALPGGRIETTVLDDNTLSPYSAKIAGLCDLDHDGRPELIVRLDGIDIASVALYHWNGRRFVYVHGYGFSA